MLTLQSIHIQSIQAHAEKTYPEECCGLLLGELQGDTKTVREVLPTENSWDEESANIFQEIKNATERRLSRRNRFSIAPQVMLKAQKDARDRNLNIIGIYHSHTDHPAIPSEFDRAIAWSQYSYVIVSVQQGSACDFKSWSLDEGSNFQPEKIHTISL